MTTSLLNLKSLVVPFPESFLNVRVTSEDFESCSGFCIGSCFNFFPEIFSFEDTGEIGDTIGGITAPFLSFFGAILIYLALKAQIEANNAITKQFEKQKIDESHNFDFNKYKERIHLIIKEVDNFEVAFHKGRLISNLSELSSIHGKKYNFGGVQGMNIFLLEYFRDKKEKELLEVITLGMII